MNIRSIGERIKYLRSSVLNLSQRRFGEGVGKTDAYISHIEKGRESPSKTLLIAISQIYKVRQEWLETGEGPMETDDQVRELNVDEILAREDIRGLQYVADAFQNFFDAPYDLDGLTDRQKRTLLQGLKVARLAKKLAQENLEDPDKKS